LQLSNAKWFRESKLTADKEKIVRGEVQTPETSLLTEPIDLEDRPLDDLSDGLLRKRSFSYMRKKKMSI
jgi:hypothetical protein